ncbi:ABC transporter permease [Paenibacillus arenilitoris]|nr:ABC transporter permease [Paenibacillus arenilitoris]
MWRIAIKEWATLRDVKMIIMMLATPVLLILIMGTAFTNSFNGSATVGEIRVLYEAPDGEGALAEAWGRFIRDAEAGGVRFERGSGAEDGKLGVQNKAYTGYVEVTEAGLRYYGNNRSGIEDGIVQGLLAAFADRYKLAAEAAKDPSGPQIPAWPGGAGADYVQETAIDAPMQPRAIDYYAIAMTTLIVMYIALSAGLFIEDERKRNTAVRLLAAPISKMDIFAGKILGMLLANTASIIAVVLISKYMFGANWGDNLWMVFLVLTTQIAFALSLGIGVSYMLKSSAAGAVTMTIIQLVALFGGSYHRIADDGTWFSEVARYSPLRWTNDGLVHLIYSDSYATASIAMLINIGFSVLLLAVAVAALRRREGL